MRRLAFAHVVLVLGTPWRVHVTRVIAQRLEGSRFKPVFRPLAKFASSLMQPKRAKTGGSRERLNAWLVSWRVK